MNINCDSYKTVVFDMADSYEEWWLVVKALAHYAASGIPDSDLTNEQIRTDLIRDGFTADSVVQAFAWIEKAQLAVHLSEIFSFVHPDTETLRVQSPLEQVGISQRFWDSVQYARQRGLMSAWQAEHLIEGARMLDTRDWEDGEVDGLMAEFLSESVTQISRGNAMDFLSAKYRDFYC